MIYNFGPRVEGSGSSSHADTYYTVKPLFGSNLWPGVVRMEISHDKLNHFGSIGLLCSSSTFYLDSIDVTALCSFSRSKLVIPLLSLYANLEKTPLVSSNGDTSRAQFLARVTMQSHAASVVVGDWKIPTSSIQVVIEPNNPVRAIVTSDLTFRDEWPPQLCRSLLDAMGFNLTNMNYER